MAKYGTLDQFHITSTRLGEDTVAQNDAVKVSKDDFNDIGSQFFRDPTPLETENEVPPAFGMNWSRIEPASQSESSLGTSPATPPGMYSHAFPAPFKAMSDHKPWLLNHVRDSLRSGRSYHSFDDRLIGESSASSSPSTCATKLTSTTWTTHGGASIWNDDGLVALSSGRVADLQQTKTTSYLCKKCDTLGSGREPGTICDDCKKLLPSHAHQIGSAGLSLFTKQSGQEIIEVQDSPKVHTLSHCKICDIPVRGPSQLKRHMAKHLQLHCCDFPSCSRKKGFSSKNDLDRHKKAVHGLVGPKDKRWRCFASGCRQADKFWLRRDNFEAHVIRMHGPEHLERCKSRSEKWWADQSDAIIPWEFDSGSIKTSPGTSRTSRHHQLGNSPARLCTQPALGHNEKVADVDILSHPSNKSRSPVRSALKQGNDLVDNDASTTYGQESSTTLTADSGLNGPLLQLCEEIGVAIAHCAIRGLLNNPEKLRQCVPTDNTSTTAASSFDNRTKSTSNTTPSRASKRVRHTIDDDGEDGGRDDEDDEIGNSADKAFTKTPRKTLACPFHKRDPRIFSKDNPDEDEARQYRNCPTAGMRDLSAVKQHCERVHTRPDHYCSRCKQKFKDEIEQDRHGNSQLPCTPKPGKYDHRMTKRQFEDMKKLKTSGLAERELYMQYWRILFPSVREPTSIYQTGLSGDVIQFASETFNLIGPRTFLLRISQRRQQGEELTLLHGFSREVIEVTFQCYFEEFVPLLHDAFEGNLRPELPASTLNLLPVHDQSGIGLPPYHIPSATHQQTLTPAILQGDAHIANQIGAYRFPDPSGMRASPWDFGDNFWPDPS